jgi:hypothetical protein
MAITTLRPLRPRRAILLRKDAQLGLFGGETEVKPTAAAKRRERMLQPKAPPKPPKPSTRATAPKEGDTRINRAGNEEVLRAGRWRLASNPKVVAKDKGSAAIVPVVEAEKPMAEVEGTLKPKGGSKSKSKREPINAGRAGKGRIRTAAQIEAIEQAQAVAREAIQRSDYKSGRERADRIVQTRQLVEVMSSGSGQRWTPSTIDGQKIAIFPDNPLGEGDTPHRMYLEGDKAGIVEPHELDEKPEPAEVVDDAPKPTKLGDRIRAIANDLRDENDEQKKIAARILGAAAQMAQNYDNLVGEVVDMVGEDLGEDIRSLNPDATQADVEMVARDGGNEPPPTRLADKMKAIANDLRNETNEQVKATARILDAAAQIAQNYDNLVDEVAEMVGEDLEAGGGAIAPAVEVVAPPTKKSDIRMLGYLIVVRHSVNEPTPLNADQLNKMPALRDYLVGTGLIQKDGDEFVLPPGEDLPLPPAIARDFPDLADKDAEEAVVGAEKRQEVAEAKQRKQAEREGRKQAEIQMGKRYGDFNESIVKAVEAALADGQTVYAPTMTRLYQLTPGELVLTPNRGYVDRVHPYTGKKTRIPIDQLKAIANQVADYADGPFQDPLEVVDDEPEMVGEDLEAGGGAIAAAVEEPMVEAEESQKEKFERIYSLSTGKRLRALNELPDDEWQAYSEWEKNKGNETASPPEPQEKSEPVAEEEKDDLLSDPFAADISLSMARQAHAGTSFDPDKRGEDEVRDYVQHLRAVQNSLNNIAETPEQQALAAAEFERYRQGYQRRYTDSLARRGRIVSPMIVGPARFPVDQMEKRRSSYERSINELLEWSDRAQNAAKKAVLAAAPGGDPTAPISSDDPDAIKKLQAQIDAAEKRQAAMKAGNKIVVDKTLTDGQKLAKLIELGIEKSDAEYALRRDGTDSRPYGFQRFQFSNNSANIRRMKQRIVTLEKKRSQSTRSITVGDIKITDDVEANRLRLVFPGKPSSEVRDKLKRSGFRWSPKEGAWQRMRSNDAIYAAEQALGIKLTKSLPPAPVFTLMGVPYIFDHHRAVLRKAGTSWEQFVADLSKEADDDPCWKGYEAVGMKKKRGKMVPNCVPTN